LPPVLDQRDRLTERVRYGRRSAAGLAGTSLSKDMVGDNGIRRPTDPQHRAGKNQEQRYCCFGLWDACRQSPHQLRLI
jgi:hypothetical protein